LSALLAFPATSLRDNPVPIEQLRTILIVALAFVSFLIWQTWQADHAPKPPLSGGSPVTASESGTPVVAPAPSAPTPHAASGEAPSAKGPGTPAPTDIPQAAAAPKAEESGRPSIPAQDEGNGNRIQRINVETDVLQVSINPVGGTIDRVKLLKYPVNINTPDQPFPLFNESLPNIFIGQTGFVGTHKAPSHHAHFTSDSLDYALQEGETQLEVRLRAVGENGASFEKTYTFGRDDYAIQVEFVVNNNSQTAWKGSAYGQFQRTQVAEEGGLFRTYTYTGGVISQPEKPYEKIDFEDMANANLEKNFRGGWIAMIQHYFAGAWVPDANQVNFYYTKALPGARYVLGVLTPSITVESGQQGSIGLTMYAGPKIQERLEKVAPNLERTVDYGWLWFIAQPLFWLLMQIQSVLVNWGWSIIVLTLLVKLAFFHLSATSYKSMANMRKVQPRIMAIRDRYQGDRQRMNQAMMDLYKEEKINPLGGCLPIVVQIPVFIALYWVLLESVELRQASFMFWLDDLSAHDPFFVLPVLMGATMIIQQRLNPPPPDPMQARIMMALPFVFTFLFLFFPSGLVLYWFVNNLLSIAQQWVITRKIVGKIQ